MLLNPCVIGAVLLSPLYLITLRFSLLPHAYAGQTPSRYWGMALFIVVGAILSVIAREIARANSVIWIETHARTPYTWFHRLAGVSISLFLAVVFFTISFAFPPDGESVYGPAVFGHIAWTNVAIAAVQLMPAISLDGGKALLEAFSIGSQWTHMGILTIFISGMIVGLVFIGGGIYWIVQGQPVVGAWLVLAGVLIIVSNLFAHKQAKAKINKYAD